LKKEATMAEEENRVYPRARLKWVVSAKVDGKVIEGVTKDISVSGAYVCCAKPLKLNVVLDMVIKAPDKSLSVKAEVVWSNIYGPDDNINPRGMGVRFLAISGEDRKVIAKAVMQHLKSDKEEIDPKLLQTLETIIIEKDQIPSEADSVVS
jgi:c-di-GMP-binding flagellar brake protein YcgR